MQNRLIAKFSLLILVFITSGCVSSDISSFTDPDYRGSPRFDSVMVFADRMGLEERRRTEDQIVQSLSSQGVAGYRSIDYAPPTRGDAFDQIADAMRRTGADALLIVGLVDQYTDESYRPPTFHPGTTYGTVYMQGNTGTLETYTTPGYTTGGYTTSKPRALYAAALYDGANDYKTAWQADGLVSGSQYNDFSDLAAFAGRDIVRLLVTDGLLVVTVATTQTGAPSGVTDEARRRIMDDYAHCLIDAMIRYDDAIPSAVALVRRATDACTQEENVWRESYIKSASDRRRLDREWDRVLEREVINKLAPLVDEYRAEGLPLAELIDFL